MKKNGALSAVYTYDADGRRVRSWDTGGTTDYVYSGLNVIDEVCGGAHEKHVYAGSLHVASNSSGTVEYYHVDHLGSTRLKTNSTGGVVYESNYEPYGPGCGESGSEDYRYTGKREDPTGLYYYGARYYDPATGRFTTRDKVFGDLTDPQSLNRYSYCRNNPHKYTDPDGKFLDPVTAVFFGTILYMGYKGWARRQKYIQNYPDAPGWAKNNEFFIGFCGQGVREIISKIPKLKSFRSSTSNYLIREAEKVENLLGAPGYENVEDYTLDEAFTDIQKDIFVDKVHSIIIPETDPDEATIEGELSKLVLKKVSTPIIRQLIDPWVLHIDYFIPIERHWDPSDPLYKDPYRYGW
jgi:RHS repeat-associated protein